MSEHQTDPLIGAQFGACIIESKVAVGGFGTIYRARDTNLGILRAVKVFHPHLSGQEEFRQRFNVEMQVLATLDHANIVSIAYSIEEPEVSGFVMEYVEGRPLSQMIKEEGQLAVDVALAIFDQVLDGIQYAHGLPEQIIHRDLTPDNVMIRPDGRVKILDFGISKTLQRQNLTQTDIILGKPLYMAPEQFEGEVTVFTDQYALGVILYEMLTGMVPFEGDSPILLYKRHLEEPIRLPPTLAEGLPDYLVKALYKSLAKNPPQRFDSVGDFLAVLRAQEWPETCQAEVDVLYQEAVLAFRRHDLEQTEVLLNKVLQADESHIDADKLRMTCRRERDEAASVQKADRAYRAAVEAHSRRADADEIHSHLRAFVEASLRVPHVMRVRKQFRRAKRKFPKLMAQVGSELDTQRRPIFDKLMTMLRSDASSQRLEALSPPRKKKTGTRRVGIFRKGIDALRKEDYEAAIGYLQQVVKNHPTHADAGRYLALSEESLERQQAAERQQHARQQMIERIFQEGVAMLDNWDYQSAISRFRQVMTLDSEHPHAREMLEDSHSRQQDADQLEEISLFYNQGMTFFQCRKFQEALTCFEQVLDRFSGHRGALEYRRRSEAAYEQSREVDALVAQGIALFRSGEYTQALVRLNRSLEIDKSHGDARRYRRLCEELARAVGS